MTEKIDKSGFFLYDAGGRPYKFASEDEVKAKRVGSDKAPGIGRSRGTAPANWEAIAAQATDRVGGRHQGTAAPYNEYHTWWEYGPLLINDPYDGIYGWFECMHRHYSPYDSGAEFDPSYGMVPL